MEVNILKDIKKEFVFEIIANKTILNPLKQRLLIHDDVEYAGWEIKHPLLANPTFYLRVKKGTAKDIALQAIEDLKTNLIELQSALEA
jgi:DNA-directed RNA polymerase subunit L